MVCACPFKFSDVHRNGRVVSKLYIVREEALVPGSREDLEEILVPFLHLNSLVSLQEEVEGTGILTSLLTS